MNSKVRLYFPIFLLCILTSGALLGYMFYYPTFQEPETGIVPPKIEVGDEYAYTFTAAGVYNYDLLVTYNVLSERNITVNGTFFDVWEISFESNFSNSCYMPFAPNSTLGSDQPYLTHFQGKLFIDSTTLNPVLIYSNMTQYTLFLKEKMSEDRYEIYSRGQYFPFIFNVFVPEMSAMKIYEKVRVFSHWTWHHTVGFDEHIRWFDISNPYSMRISDDGPNFYVMLAMDWDRYIGELSHSDGEFLFMESAFMEIRWHILEESRSMNNFDYLTTYRIERRNGPQFYGP